MPRPPPPARTSPPLVQGPLLAPRSRTAPLTESLPIAPKQLLSPITPNTPNLLPMKSSKRKPTPIHILPPPNPDDETSSLPIPIAHTSIPYVSALDSPPSMPDGNYPSAPVVPSSPRFDNDLTRHSHRPKLQRTQSSHADTGFTFDFAPNVPEKEQRQQRPRSRARESATKTECMNDFVSEYVQMRRSNARKMPRNQRFPVAGQSMHMTGLGSVYTVAGRV